MFYREAGDFSTTYREDSQTFPIKFDRYRYYAVLLIAFAIIPFLLNDYWVNAIFLPFLILFDRGNWIEYSHGLLWSSFAGHGRLYGCWGLCDI